jgi:hypothetical protein
MVFRGTIVFFDLGEPSLRGTVIRGNIVRGIDVEPNTQAYISYIYFWYYYLLYLIPRHEG